MATHYDIVSVASVPSTQDVASSGLNTTRRPTLVVAEHQTQGRGRQGRSWEEPDRALFSSLAFQPAWPAQDRAVITLCTAVALAGALDAVTGVRCDIKWPNDLLVEGGKVAGILVEARGDMVVVGCGVNLWWPGAPEYAGALFADDPGGDLGLSIARAWVDALLTIIDDGPAGWPRDTYLERSSTVGGSVTWDGGSGRAVGIADNGGLIVDTGDGEKIITAGEVHTRQGR